MRASNQFDVLIIGSGAAGLGLALSLADHARIAIISKEDLLAGSSQHAQGGIAAVMNKNEKDIALHIKDTLNIGAGLCDPSAVRYTVENAKPAIEWLIKHGVKFTTEKNGQQFHLTQEGGHSQRRILHTADKTGAEVVGTLAEQVIAHPNIHCFSEHTAIDLILKNKTCVGANILDNKTNAIISFYAKEIVLATGGASYIYQHTTNPDTTSGDGVAMASRAGCRVANMEFNQFHPTLFYANTDKPFLISEALRGEGGQLVLHDGKRFMQKYDARAEMAPRDIVARAIDYELITNKIDCVYLNISHQPTAMIQAYFPTIYQYCLQHNVDITKEPIPVVPAAHYTCGGVITNLKGQTDIPHLYAIGEVACTGLHGANRMASNSLLECLVFAASASQAIKVGLTKNKYVQAENNTTALSSQQSYKTIEADIALIRNTMWGHVGIVRSNAGLKQAKNILKSINNKLEKSFHQTQITKKLLTLRNLAQVADLMIQAAIDRKENRGLHFNLDQVDETSTATDATHLSMHCQKLTAKT